MKEASTSSFAICNYILQTKTLTLASCHNVIVVEIPGKKTAVAFYTAVATYKLFKKTMPGTFPAYLAVDYK